MVDWIRSSVCIIFFDIYLIWNVCMGICLENILV